MMALLDGFFAERGNKVAKGGGKKLIASEQIQQKSVLKSHQLQHQAVYMYVHICVCVRQNEKNIVTAQQRLS